MRIAVLGAPSGWHFKDLQRAAGDDHQVRSVPFSAVGASIGLNGDFAFFSGNVDLTAFDCLLVRTMPPGSLEQVVFRMDVLARWQDAGRLVVNPPRSVEVAVDKYLALTRLERAGLNVPATVVCQTFEEAMQAFQRLGRDVVVKPLFGSEGRGMTRISDEDLAVRAFKMLDLMNAVIYVQRFIEHQGRDYRLLVIGQQTLGMCRHNTRDWRTNISRGATAEPMLVDQNAHALALRAAGAVGAPLAGVDVLPARDGSLYVLEVNAVPGWKAIARTLKVDVASMVLEHLASM